ncbi:MAG: hypothetical protein WCX31_04215, partial [Salinivirgaceae bacterium]
MLKKYFIAFFIFSFNFFLNAQQQVDPVFPKDIGFVTDTVVEFVWNPITDAQTYTFQISDNQNFASSTIISDIIANKFTYTNLEFNKTYYWKAKADNSNWSSTKSFETFSPKGISTINGWFSADYGVSHDINGFIEKWYDKTDSSKTFYQNVATSKPLLKENTETLNNNSVIYFDGLNDYFYYDSSISIGSVFILLNYTKASVFTGDGSPGLLTGKTISDIFYGQNGTTNIVTTYLNSTVINNVLKTNFSLLPTYKILGGYKNTPTLIPDLTLGQLRNLGSRYWTGNIAELLLFETKITSDEATKIHKYFQNRYTPPINLGEDIIVRNGFGDTSIMAHQPWYVSYQWSTVSSDSAITVSRRDAYSVTVTDIFGFTSSDTINVIYPEISYPISGTDTTICFGDTIWWDTGLHTDFTYLWQGSTQVSSTIPIFDAGQYSVTVTDSLGYSIQSDTITVAIDGFNIVDSLGPDRYVCK